MKHLQGYQDSEQLLPNFPKDVLVDIANLCSKALPQVKALNQDLLLDNVCGKQSFSCALPGQQEPIHFSVLHGIPDFPQGLIMSKCLAKGTFGTLHMAWDNQQQRLLAIKKLRLPNDIEQRKEMKTLTTSKDSLLQELSIQRKLGTSSQIVTAVSQANKKVLLVLDTWFDGDAAGLRQCLRRYGRQQDIAQIQAIQHVRQQLVWQLARQLSEQLAVAHCSNILHGDVKMTNVLVQILDTKLGDVRFSLADFGCAQVLDATGKTSNTLLGTASFWGPEYYVDFTKEQTDLTLHIDKQADIWSMGLTLLDWVTNHPMPLFDAMYSRHHFDTFGSFRQQVLLGLAAKQPLRKVLKDMEWGRDNQSVLHYRKYFALASKVDLQLTTYILLHMLELELELEPSKRVSAEQAAAWLRSKQLQVKFSPAPEHSLLVWQDIGQALQARSCSQARLLQEAAAQLKQTKANGS